MDVQDGLVSLHHRAVAEWVVSERASPPLAVALPAARLAMADAVMTWLAPVIGDEPTRDTGTFTLSVGFHSFLTVYFTEKQKQLQCESKKIPLEVF